MILDQLNLNHVRIFEAVFRTKSMTAAARELHLTQSGVSQHMRSFEEVMGVKLFDRINQRVVPTATAIALYEKCSSSLKGLEEAFQELNADKNQLSGRVHLGMPTEFGLNVMIPLIAKFSEKHPKVRFHFRLGYGAEMNQLLLNAEVDFALIDEFTMDKKIKTQPVYDEMLELCASPELVERFGKKKESEEYFESLDYVDFNKDEQILRRWFKHHFGNDSQRLNVKATVEDSQAIARLVRANVGAGILAGHYIRRIEREGTRVHIFKGKKDALKNTISIATLKDRTQSRSSQAVLEFILKELADLKKRSSA